MLQFLITGIIVVICVCQVPGGGCAEPCLDAVQIGDYRRSTNYKPDEKDPLMCDTNLNESLWYRFDAITGGRMPETCVTTLHCGTMIPIWMNDVHPTAANPGPKTAKVCAPYWLATDDCTGCDWTGSIKVLWCQDLTTLAEYFVYQLKKPPFCSMAYCAGDGVACKKDCSWNGVTKTCSCPAYPDMTGPPVLEVPRVVTGPTQVRNAYPPGDLFYPTRFVVDCTVGYPTQTVDVGARFNVIFEMDGQFIASLTVNSMAPVATLDESYLIGHIGGTLTCRVSSYWDSSDAGSKYLFSNKRWFGLSPVDEAGVVIANNLEVKEGQTVSFWMDTSFPITSRPCYDVPTFPCFYKTYSFSIHASDSVVRLSDCALVVTQSSPRSGEVEISPIPTIGSRQKPFVWQLNFNAYNDTILNLNIPKPQRDKLTPIFKNYQIQSINIEIVDPDPQPLCQSTGDPHILAFPDPAGVRAYYHIYSIGVFYLVQLASRNLQIQVMHVPCNPGSLVPVSCNCGVICREGNSIFGINACNQVTPLLVNYRLDNISPTGTIETTSTGFKMTLVSGIVINVILAAWSPGFMDVYVTGIRSELTEYNGLCSVQGLNNVECTTACDRYRVADADSFFNINSNNLPKCGTPYFIPTCQCYGKNIDQSVNVTCAQPTGDALLQIDCTKVCSKRKRAADDLPPSTFDTIDLDDLNYIPPQGFFSVVAPTDGLIKPNIVAEISIEDATETCTAALKKSPVYDRCISSIDTAVIVAPCALDCQLLRNYGPADSVPTQLELSCLSAIEMRLEDPATNNNTDELINLYKEVKKLVCPSQCSGRGTCNNGVCSCNEGYVGNDCTLVTGQAPSILRIISPVCNYRQQPCKKICLQANHLASPESITCKLEYDDESGGITTIHLKPEISGGVAVCYSESLPMNINDEQSIGRRYTIRVSLSNDGMKYSPVETYTAYDSQCETCASRPTLSCQTKPNGLCKLPRSQDSALDGASDGAHSTSTKPTTSNRINVIDGPLLRSAAAKKPPVLSS